MNLSRTQERHSRIFFHQDNLHLIKSTGAEEASHNDLIPHILLQLRNAAIPVLQQSVQRNYNNL